MPFQENDKRINRDGRPKGAKNKVPYNLREKINEFLNDNFEAVKEGFEGLDAKDKIKFFLDFIQYSVPKLQSVNIDTLVEISEQKTKLSPFEQIRINSGIINEREIKEKRVLKSLPIEEKNRYLELTKNVPVKNGKVDLSNYKTEDLKFMQKIILMIDK